MKSEESTRRAEIGEVLASFERASGLYVCFRPLSELWRTEDGRAWMVPPPYTLHRSAFCTAMKAKRLDACERCDLNDLHSDCDPNMKALVRPCHARAMEILVPLWLRGVLVGVLFVGQFRRTSKGPAGLPIRTEGEVEHLSRLALMIRAYMLNLMHWLESRRHSVLDGRSGQIETFIRTRLKHDPSLEDLAEHLSLSVSRTSHLVNELLGVPFRSLKEQYRLDLAKDLLTSTSAKIAYVAAQLGFTDSDYFCRYFKSKTTLTPTQYRRQYAREFDV
jgi:AraC-like DNA-binding protein